MTAAQLDDWGRDWTPVALPKVSAPAASPPPDRPLRAAPRCAACDDALQALTKRVAALEAMVTKAGEPPAALVPFERRLYPWIGRLAEVVADEWGCSAVAMMGRSGAALHVRPRFVLTWLVRQAGYFSLNKVGQLLSRDHSSILYAMRRVNEWRRDDEVFRHVTDQLLAIARRLRAEASSKAGALAAEGGGE